MKPIHYLLLLLIMLGCSKKLYQTDYYKKSTPPYSLRIGENLFIDKTEVANKYYRFFTEWMKTFYGDSSNEYRHALPDTLVWLGQVENDTFLMQHYFRAEKFNYFPVVGISHDHAQLYSNWRANMFFKSMLIHHKIIKPPSPGESPELFTIQKYLKGEYKNIEPDRRIMYYPVFRLPIKQEVQQAKNKFDKLRLEYFLSCRDEHCNYCQLDEYQFASQKNVEYQMETFGCPTRHIFMDCRSIAMFKMHNLKGNVAEWMSSRDSTFGGGWKDNIESGQMIYSKSQQSVGATIGFRNVSKWKKIDWENYD